MPTIVLEGISKQYNQGKNVIQAVGDITLHVKAKEFVSIIGPSGCGKTTLLRMIGGLCAPTHGQILTDGRTAYNTLHKRNMGFVFQTPQLLRWRTAIENVMLPLEIREIENRDKAVHLFQMLGIDGFEEIYPHQLSRSMQTRVSIARALVMNPTMLLMDEPFADLDAMTRDRLNLELAKLWSDENTQLSSILFVTHSIAEAIFLSDRIVVLSKRPGRIKKIIAVPLPRPRTLDVREKKEFFSLERDLRSLIEES